jgi:hypothetical protein
LSKNGRPDNQAKNAAEPAVGEKQPPPASEAKSQEKPKEGAYEASEFWTVWGRTLKITDSLLVGFTFLLFLATVALFVATRDLVDGADKTAERQLRAYIGLHEAETTIYPVEGGDSASSPALSLKTTGRRQPRT